MALCVCTATYGATFGRVVAIGGQASDLALDEARGVLYIANFTANRIEIMSLKDHTIQRSMNVAAQPGALSLSPDGRYLLVAHFGNYQAPDSPNNALTLIELNTAQRQTFGLGAPPLGVAFGVDGRALVVTSTEFLSFDPETGATNSVGTVSGVVANALPQPPATAPSQIVATSLGTSADGVFIYGVTNTFEFQYNSSTGIIRAYNYTSSPQLGPRALSVNRDGSVWIAGWSLNDANFNLISQIPNVTGALNIGTVQLDSGRNLLYGQYDEVNSTRGPNLIMADVPSLTVRERFNLIENLSGKSLMSADGNNMYALSESGVTVFPVGQLGQFPRVRSESSQLLFRGNNCERSAVVQEIVITSDGGPADFVLVSDNPDVQVSPSRGTTPAAVRVTANMAAFSGNKGTTSAKVDVLSAAAINQITPVDVLVNSKEPDQRGSVVPVAGKLVDILADPTRDRFFVLRQDTNEVLVFDGANFLQTASLPTFNTPKSMTITFDRRWLLVGCDNSQLINVYDLETLTQSQPIRIADYVQSIAASANAILAATRSSSGGDNQIHRIDFANRKSSPLRSLGVFQNRIVRDTVMVASNNGRSIVIAQSDGNLMLYDAVQDTFTVSRKEARPLAGPYAGSSFDKFVIGDALLNASLVPERRFETESGRSAGFWFLDNTSGFRFTAPSSSAPGILQRVDLRTGGGIRPTRTIEAPLFPGATTVFSRTLAPLYSRNVIAALTTSGVTVFPWEYDAATIPPRIDRVVNAADLSANVAPGGLISVFGSSMSPVSQATKQIPLPTALAESCLTVNGIPIPMILASPERINAQLPFTIDGSTTFVLRTPGGISDNFNVTILPGAPGVFRTALNGSDVPVVIRQSNNQIVTASNPIRRNEFLTIYLTGLGRTNPAVEAGVPTPSGVTSTTILNPTVTIGDQPVEVLFSGLVPNEIGIYQINVKTNGRVPLGMNLPLQITQSGSSTSVTVRVVD